MPWLLPRNELTPEQLQAIELSSLEHKVVFGAPGSGKTQILLHRARYLCNDISRRMGRDARFHIFVFTNVLKSYIESALDILDLPKASVSTIDAWCLTFYGDNIGRRTPWNANARRPDFITIRNEVLAKVSDGTMKMPLFDFVLVDEGQDLDDVSFEILSRIARHITVCIDHKQKIYERGLDENEILERLGLRRRNMALLAAFRCSPYIVKLGAQFIENNEDRTAYIRQSRTEHIERETPLLYYASNFEDEKRRLIELVRTRLERNERIGILFPKNRQVYGFARGLVEAGLDVERPPIDGQGGYDFNSPNPKVLTFHSAKGLTFDTIIIPRLVSESFPILNNENQVTHNSRITRLLFVGITRAQKWVSLISSSDNTRLPQLDRLSDLARQGFLTIQENQRVPASQYDPPQEDEDGGLTDLL